MCLVCKSVVVGHGGRAVHALSADALGRSIVAVSACVLLSACAARDPFVSNVSAKPVGNWRIERQLDRVTGSPLSSAFLLASSSSNSAILFVRPAMLQLLCFRDEPVVRFEFGYKVGATRNSVLGYSFDNMPGREVDARFLQDHATVVIEDKNEVAQFAGELATSNVLYVRIRSLNAGRTSAEFRVAGAPAAIDAAFARCPLPTAPPAKRTGA